MTSGLCGSTGKAPVPSSLRYETRPESTDDERAVDQPHVQVPNSDVAIPETQLEQDDYQCGHAGSEVPLSLNDDGILAKCAVSRDKKSLESEPFEAKLLSREGLSRHHEPNAPQFSFASNRPSALNNPSGSNPSIVKTVGEPVSGYGTLRQTLNPEAHDVTSLHQTSIPPNIGAPARHTERDENVRTSSFEQRQILAAFAEAKGKGVPDHEVPESSRAVTNMRGVGNGGQLGFVQDGHVLSLKLKQQMPLFKKGRDSRKVPPGQQRTSPWPPKSSQSRRMDGPTKNWNHNNAILDVVPGSSAEHVQPFNQQDSVKSVPKERFATSLSTAEELQKPRHTAGDHTVDEENQCQQHVDGLINPVHRVFRQELIRGSSGPPNMVHRAHEEKLHMSSAQDGPNRVAKPRRKQRVTSATTAPISHKAVRPLMPKQLTPLAGAFEFLKATVLAEEVRQEYKSAATSKNHEDYVAALQQAIETQKSRIEALEVDKAALQNSMERQRDRAINLRKYVDGIQNDHEKLKAEAKVHYKECSRVLADEVHTVQQEKIDLENDFQDAINASANSQRSLRKALDDCVFRLELSEAMKRSMADQLLERATLFKEEKKKREELEQNMMASLHSVERLVQDTNGTLLDKLGSILASVENNGANDSHDTRLQECVDALRNMRETPFLTIKDLEKAQGMLRFVHEGIMSKLETISISVELNHFPAGDVQNLLRDEIEKLRNDVLKYEDATAEHLKVHQSNEVLSKELNAEKLKSEKLDGQVKILQQSEVHLKTQSARLENELKTMKDMARDSASLPSELEREMVNLRAELRGKESDLRQAAAKAEAAEKLQEIRENEAAEWKHTAEADKARLEEATKASKKKDKKAVQCAKEAREMVLRECKRVIEAKEATMGNEIHRLTREVADKERLLQEMDQNLHKSQQDLQRATEQPPSIESGTQTPREEVLDAGDEQTSSAASAEFADLEKRLVETLDALRDKEREADALRQDYLDQHIRASTLQQTVQEYQSRIFQANQSEATLQETQTLIYTLQQEKQDLESAVQQAGSSNESLLKTVESNTAEKEKLQGEVVELQAIRLMSELELQKLRQKSAEDYTKAVMEHESGSRDLRRQIEHLDQARKEADIKVRRMEQELEAFKKECEQKMEEKYREAVRAMSASRPSIQHSTIQSSEPRSLIVKLPFSTGLPSSQVKQRKKVDRQRNSIMDVAVPYSDQANFFNGRPNSVKEPITSMSDDFDGVDLDALAVPGSSQNMYDSIHEPAPEAIPETQEEEILDFQPSKQPEGSRQSSSSQLSEADQEWISSYEQEQLASSSTRRIADCSPLRPDIGDAYVTPNRTDTVVQNVQTFDRPASRANTGTRMAPPQITPSRSSRVNQTLGRPASLQNPDVRMSRDGSPNYAHGPSSKVPKATYTGMSTSSGRLRAGTPVSFDGVDNHKRKSSGTNVDNETSSKRFRGSSFSLPSALPHVNPSSASGSPRPSHSQKQMRSSRQSPATAVTRSSRAKRTKYEEYNARYQQEL